MSLIKKTVTTTSTWLGRPGTAVEHRLTYRLDGPRVDVHTWHDTGETIVRGITGNLLRKPSSFHEVYDAVLPAPVDPKQLQVEIAAAIEALRHFSQQGADR